MFTHKKLVGIHALTGQHYSVFVKINAPYWPLCFAWEPLLSRCQVWQRWSYLVFRFAYRLSVYYTYHCITGWYVAVIERWLGVNDPCSDIVCTVYGIRPIAERLEHSTENTERQGFLSSRPNWLPPPPHPQASVASPPPCFRRGGHTRLGRGGGGSKFGRRDRHSGTLGTCTVKEGLPFSRPQPVCHWSNSPWTGII
jgi:hypothetical protein